MDKTAEVVVGSDHLIELIEALLALDGAVHPLAVSDGEDQPRIPLNSSKGREYYLDRIPKEFGFLFFAQQATFLFIPWSKIGWRVYVTEIHETDAAALMQAVAKLPIIFAYACEWEELLFLNQVSVALSYGTEEAWVGQDIGRYVPGIYWITVLPIARVSKWNELTELARERKGMEVRRTPCNIYLRLYERAADWRDRQLARKVAELLDCPVFDKSVVLSQIDGTEDFQNMSDKLAQWP